MAALYLAMRPGGHTFAIAGRSRAKLEALAADLAEVNIRRPPAAIIEVAADDLDALRALVRRTRVVFSAAGPYKLFAPQLVRACVEEGTHYVDVNGEPFFTYDMITRHHSEALAKGVKIVVTAGIISVPFELGAHLALDAVESELEHQGLRRGVVDITGYLGKLVGGSSDMSSSFQSAALDQRDGLSRPALARDPYMLAPEAPCKVDTLKMGWGLGNLGLRYVRSLGQLAVGNAMTGHVTAGVVRRGMELLGRRNVSYADGMLPFDPPGQPRAPRAGEGRAGPSRYCVGGACRKTPEELQRHGFLRVFVTAEDRESGASAMVSILSKEDPAYKHTAKLAIEVSLCLTDATCHNPRVRGGVLTAVSATDPGSFLRALQAGQTDEGEPMLSVEVHTSARPSSQRRGAEL